MSSSSIPIAGVYLLEGFPMVPWIVLFVGLSLVGCRTSHSGAGLKDDAGAPVAIDTAEVVALTSAYPRTTSAKGKPADIINLVIIGSQPELEAAFAAAGWSIADPLNEKTAARLAADTVVDRSYPKAPVSTQKLFDRAQDVAVEQQVNHSPKRRHHSRFWLAPTGTADGRHIWLGGAVFDTGIAFSKVGGPHFTHMVDPNIDKERDFTADALKSAGQVQASTTLPGFGPDDTLVNGDGNPMTTEGDLLVVVLQANPEAGQTSNSSGTAEALPL